MCRRKIENWDIDIVKLSHSSNGQFSNVVLLNNNFSSMVPRQLPQILLQHKHASKGASVLDPWRDNKNRRLTCLIFPVVPSATRTPRVDTGGLWTLDFKVGCQSAWHYQVSASKYFLFASWTGENFRRYAGSNDLREARDTLHHKASNFPCRSNVPIYRPIKDEWLGCPWAGYLGSYTGGKQFRWISRSLRLEPRSSGTEAEAASNTLTGLL